MKPTSPVGVARIHIHEDDEGLSNIYPATGFADAEEDLTESAEASLRNLAPGGVGWTDMHQIQAPAEDIETLAMPLDRVEALISPHLPRIGRYVATAMGGFDPDVRDPYGVYLDNPWCFGFDQTCFIFIRAKGMIADDIWYIKDTGDATQLAAMKSAFRALESEWRLCLADYTGDGASGLLSDVTFLDRYFSPVSNDT